MPDGDTGAGEDGLEHEEHQLVELVSSGRSCPICEAPDGMCFEEDPTPIHDLCDCEVRLGERSTTYRPPGERECGENPVGARLEPHRVSLGRVRNSVDPAERPEPVKTYWDLIVSCWDGETITVDVTVTHDPGTDPQMAEDEAWNELYDTAEDIVATECRGCDPPRVS